MLQSQGHGSQEKPGPQVMAAHAPKSGQGGRVSLRHWHPGPVESNTFHFQCISHFKVKDYTHGFDLELEGLLSARTVRYYSCNDKIHRSSAVGTHRTISQLQGHGSQQKPGPQVMATHAS